MKYLEMILEFRKLYKFIYNYEKYLFSKLIFTLTLTHFLGEF